MVNYNYPSTNLEKSQPISIIVHDSKETPDIENIKGRNFDVYPGMETILAIPTTILNSTTNFDEMGVKSRHCNKNKMYKEINCIMDKILDNAASQCGCKTLNIYKLCFRWGSL